MSVVLASTSPRRREILALLGLPFEVIDPNVEEIISPDRPIRDEALDFARQKAAAVARSRRESIVIGSDTMILLGERKIGKPDGIAGARAILRALAGNTHWICTAVAIIDGPAGRNFATLEEVAVQMRDYSDAEIESYLARGESLDKAGAYSIQGGGRHLIDSIRGDYLAAVGLPLKPIAEYLAARGIDLPVDVGKLYAEKNYLNWKSF